VTTDITQTVIDAQPNNLLTPVAVSSDGIKLFVTDLGHNRVLIWNTIPDQNQASADVVVGQKDMNTAIANDAPSLCPPTGVLDDKGNPTYPARCENTLEYPRFALSTGTQLFIADGGNDRILVFNTIPTQNGQGADAVLGQPVVTQNQVSDSANPEGRSAADVIATPMSLAWDGANLFASDPFYRRVMIFTPAEDILPYNGVRNAASLEVHAVGTFTFSGTIKEADDITLKISDKPYEYKIKAGDSFASIVLAFVSMINDGDGDPNVIATPNLTLNQLILTAKVAGDAGNSITISQTLSTGAVIVVTASSSTLSGGQNAAKIAPGTLVTLLRKDGSQAFTDHTESAPDNGDVLPYELAGVQVYFDGLRAPMLFASPDKVTVQIPYDVNDATSVSAYVRSKSSDGRVIITDAVAVPIVTANPGVFAEEGTDPRVGIVTHYSSYATGTISVDGTANAGDIATVLIEDRPYSYTVVTGDTLESIRDALIQMINDNPAEKVIAFQAGVFTRIRLKAKVIGPEGNGIAIGGKTNDGAQVILTATNSALCCANIAGAPVTPDNPALPGETIVVIATGLGIVNPDEAKIALATGFKYRGPEINRPNEFVSSLAGGRTANVLFSGLKVGQVGLYEVDLELNSDIPTNPFTQLTIAQDIYVSNIITLPVVNPKDATGGTSTGGTTPPAPELNRITPQRQIVPAATPGSGAPSRMRRWRQAPVGQ
jgi:uncharacterized protein (TIGR03437 family)